MMKTHRVYACYKGDELLAMGTVPEIAEALGVKPSTVYYYNSKVYQSRNRGKCRVLVCVDE